MSVQAPAITGVNTPGIGVAPGFANWLRGIGVRQVRLACGLVMFSYIFSHFFNHALGNVSYALMEKWLTLHIWWWRIPIVNATLNSAAAIHFSLGLWALYQRRRHCARFAQTSARRNPRPARVDDGVDGGRSDRAGGSDRSARPDDRSRAGSGLIERLPVGRSAEMRDLLEINGAWREERHDAYKRCAFADLHRDTGAVAVRLHSHPVIA